MRSFALFLAVFLSLYGLVHAYAYVKLRCIFPWKRPRSYLVAAAFIFLMLSPVLGQGLFSLGLERQAVMMLFVGYEWMGLVFLFISAQVFGDCLRLLLLLIRRGFSRISGSFPGRTARPVAVAAASVAVCAFAYGHFEANRLSVHLVELHSGKLPAGVEGVRIVQVSDLHFSPLKGAVPAGQVAKRIEELAPDMLVATGDLVDRGMADSNEIARIFRSIETPLGSYAVTGNHEFYGNGIHVSLDFLEKAGFRVLRGETTSPLPWLSIVGVDDEASYSFGGPAGQPLEALLSQIPPENLVLLLRHRPNVNEEFLGRFDLQLSGHTHGGQIFPFNLIVSLVYPYIRGEYDLGKGSVLHVNRGTGTWGPPVRVGSPPEITLVHIRPKS